LAATEIDRSWPISVLQVCDRVDLGAAGLPTSTLQGNDSCALG
jgi:hypothetical protein